MPTLTKFPGSLVFGLDIGTRSIVGTVGYREGKQFNIVAQTVRFHDTRAMLDGQIHDIVKISEEIVEVKQQLEEQLSGRKLKEVCIAAAGRVLKTAVGKGFYEFPELTSVNQEYIHSIEIMGVEQAHEKMLEEKDTNDKFFCVGYSVIKYYLNDYVIGNLEGQKAHKISADVLATFLPEEVVDSLYAAVEMAGLEVANLTLEPIAAILVAIPENYRLLNIALVDVGAGTSDISITKDGSIIGYGMLPKAGDELTETLIREYLVDFDTAETIKMIGVTKKPLTYKDILSVPHKITPEEVFEKLDPLLDEITEQTAKRIIELNGGKSVAAAFVVGGGGKMPGYIEKLAKHLGLPPERVGLRGEEVLGNINIMVDDVVKDPLLVTPIGICLNYYEQKNRFIYLFVNGERVKLYDNDKLTVFDAAMAYGLNNDDVFPKRGADINYTINGKKKFIRGCNGEACEILLNDSEAGMNHLIQAGDKVEIKVSTKGEDATALLENVVDLSNSIKFNVNDIIVECPRYASVNGKLESGSYELNDGDEIEILSYYTLTQLMQFMDIETPHEVFVNGARANADTKIYENFNVAWIDREDIYLAEKYVTEEEVELDEADSENTDDTIKEAGNENLDSAAMETGGNNLDSAAMESGGENLDSAAMETGGENLDSTTKESDSEDLDSFTKEYSSQMSDSAAKETDGENSDSSMKKADSDNSVISNNKSSSKRKSKKDKKKRTNIKDEKKVQENVEEEQNFSEEPHDIHLMVNDTPVTLSGKSSYVFIDIFDKYDFDLKNVGGTKLIQQVDGVQANYLGPIYEGSKIDLYWEQ